MAPSAEIKNRSVLISTDNQEDVYCRTAMLFYVLDGNVEIEYDMRKIRLKETDILVLNRGTSYSLQSAEPFVIASLELMGRTFESVCDGIHYMVRCNSCADKNEHYTQLRSLLRQMILNQIYVEEDEQKYSYLVFEYYSLYYRLLETIIAYFMDGHAGNPGKGKEIGKQEDRIREIERYINIHYMEPISLETIAAELFLSKGYLSKFFTQCFGITFSQYLKEVRLKHAMSDLLYTEKPVTQIAMDNGFSGSSFFNRAFREKFGKNPTEIRKEFSGERTQEKGNEKTNLKTRLRKLLEMPENPVSPEESKEKYRFSVQDYHRFEHCWNSVINIGSASEVLRTDMQAHIMILSKYFTYARFWNPFSKEMLLDINSNRGVYNFLRIDQALDSLLNCGMKPFIVFEPKLERVNEGADSVIIKAEHNPIIDDIRSWKKITTAFMRHITQKYGIEEVEQWKFELTYGVYQLRGLNPTESYLELFSTLSESVREYTQKLMLGGPALTSADSDVLQKILLGLKERNCQLDYISMISFAYEVNERARKYSVRNIDEDYLVKDVKKYRKIMEQSGFAETPLYITEWNETVADRNFVNDSCYRGAYVVKSLLEINSYVSAAGYFSGSDLRAEYFDSVCLLQGGNGMLSRDGIFKPAGFAVELMNLLGDYQIGRGKNFLITTDRHDNYYIIAHNKRKLSYYYYKTPEEKIEKEKSSGYCEDEEPLELKLELEDMKNGEYQIRIHKVNQHYGSILNLWKELDYSEQLSRKDIMYIQRICEPHLLFFTENVTQNRLPLKFVMEPNEIILIEVKRVL